MMLPQFLFYLPVIFLVISPDSYKKINNYEDM
jgi:hypothetical protein